MYKLSYLYKLLNKKSHLRLCFRYLYINNYYSSKINDCLHHRISSSNPHKNGFLYSEVNIILITSNIHLSHQFLQNNEKTPDSSNSTKQAKETPTLSAKARIKEAVSKVIPRKKTVETTLSRERNFLTAIRAMSEFMLSPADLEGLRHTQRRSPFENEPPIIVYWRKDVESRALKVWGSMEALDKERDKLEKDLGDYQEYIFNLKKKLRNYQKAQKQQQQTMGGEPLSSPPSFASLDDSGKVVWTAVVINGLNFVVKLGAWTYTGSHCLFAEALHSFADFTNQVILAYGIYKSGQAANLDHPYGFTTMRYVSSLVSGAVIFCVGAGLSVQHGITALLNPTEVVPLYWAFFILGGSLITEGGTLVMAVSAIRKGAKKEDLTFMQYVLRSSDPSVNVVLLEDLAAVTGVGVALGCMGLTSFTGSHVPDAIGSCVIGGLLAGVSGFIIYTNTAALVGRSILRHDLQELNEELEMDVMIRAIHDVKGIDMGSGLVRYKAEVDFDGRELTRKYIDKNDIDMLFMEMNGLKTAEEAEAFLLKHGENIVDSLGAEVDRIERTLKKKHPEVRHIDLEIL